MSFALTTPTHENTIPFPAASTPSHVDRAIAGRQLLRLEDQIRAHYQARRRRLTPSYRAKASEEAFARAAELVFEAGADPHEFVDALFEANTFGSFPPPNHLFAAGAVEKWRRYRDRQREQSLTTVTAGPVFLDDQVCKDPRVQALWSCQLFYLECLRKHRGLSDEAVFLAEGSPLRAWFRLALAPAALRAVLENRWGGIARRQLADDQPLRHHLERLAESPQPHPFTLNPDFLQPTTPFGPGATTTARHATLRPLRQALPERADGAPAAHRVIPFPG